MSPGLASAQGSANEASRLLSEAQRAFAAGKLDEACPKLARSHQLSGSLPTLLLSGDCEAKAGREKEALAAYRTVKSKAEAAGDQQLVTLASMRIGPLEKKLGPAASPLPDAAAPPADAPAAAAPPEPPPRGPKPDVQPLDRVGDTEWHDGVGFVRPGTAPTTEPEAAPALPGIVGSNLDKLAFEIGGRGSYFDAGEAFGVAIAVQLGHEWRETTSLFAPWFTVGGAIGPAFGDNVEGITPELSARVGLDWHPFRRQWIGFGPYVGYRMQALIDTGNDDLSAGHGPEWLGARIRVRTKEAPDDPPAVDAEFRISLRTDAATTLPHLGHDLRFPTAHLKLFVDLRLGDRAASNNAAEGFPMLAQWGFGYSD